MSKKCKSIVLSIGKIKSLKSLIKGKDREENLLSKIIEDKGICDPYKKYIENSVYIVPPNTLLAYQYVNGAHIPITDQTVWVINKYDRGYYFGKVYVALNGESSSTLNLVGSVTPFGDVYMTFFPTNGSLKDTDIVTGIGKFIITENGGYFTMQMNTAQNSLYGVEHWSYMISVKPDDYLYQHLPSLNISVPDFISQFASPN